MKDKPSKLRVVVPLIAALAAGSAGAVSAQEAVNNSTFNTPTGDFMFVTDYMHEINRNETTDVNALVKGGDSRKGVKPKIYAIDPSEAIKREIAFLNSERGREFYGEKKDGRRLVGKLQNFLDKFYKGAEKDEQRLKLIGRYQNFLNELKRQNIVTSKKSLETLSAGLSDGILKPGELTGVEDNVYAIVKEGYDKEAGNYTVLYLTRLTSETTPTQYQARIKELEDMYNQLEQKAQTPDLETPKQEASKQEKDYRSVYLQAQQTASADLTSYITSIGARWNPFEKVDIGFGANLDIGFGLDNQTDSYTAPLSAGRTASGTITDMGKFSIGGSLEAQFGPLIVGGGIDYKLWTEKVLEQILSQSGSVVKSNTNSTPNRQVFGKVYGGVEIPFGKNVKIGMIYGYNGRDDMFFGIRGGFKIK